jgi:hypothetical protein
MAATTTPTAPTAQAADLLAKQLLVLHPELIGVEECESDEEAITFFFESGHWAVIKHDSQGLIHELHDPDEE